MAAFTFRASAQVWSVKRYLLLYTSAHSTTWDFIQPPPAEARIYLVVSLQQQHLHTNGEADERKCGNPPLPAVFTLVSKIFPCLLEAS